MQPCLNNPVKLGIGDVPINMDKPVSEPRHLDQGIDELRIESSFFLHGPEGISIVFWRSKAILGNDMIA